MDGFGGSTVLKLIGPIASGTLMGTGGFQPNGASNPLTTSFRGTLKGLMTVTYAATGKLTVAFPKGFSFPTSRFPQIVMSSTSVDITNTNRFWVTKLGDWDNTNRQFIIQCVQTDAAFQVPNNAANWIDFTLVCSTKSL